MLPPYIRVIQGDGISYESLSSFLDHMKANKWSVDNLAFGSGGSLLQKVDRDTQKLLMFNIFDNIINNFQPSCGNPSVL